MNVEDLYPKFKSQINSYQLEDLILKETNNKFFSYLATIYLKHTYGVLGDYELFDYARQELYRMNWI